MDDNKEYDCQFVCYSFVLSTHQSFNTNMKQGQLQGPLKIKVEPQFSTKMLTDRRGTSFRDNCVNPHSISFHIPNVQNPDQPQPPDFIEQHQIYRQRLDNMFPIIRSSPGYRLLNGNTTDTSARILPTNLEELDSTVLQLKAIVQTAIEQIICKYLKKIECFRDFLSENAIFKINRKLQDSGPEHQDCCMRLINILRELDERGQATESTVQEIVRDEAQRSRQLLNYQISYIKVELKRLLGNVKLQIDQGSVILADDPQPQHPISKSIKQISIRSVKINEESGYLKTEESVNIVDEELNQCGMTNEEQYQVADDASVKQQQEDQYEGMPEQNKENMTNRQNCPLVQDKSQTICNLSPTLNIPKDIIEQQPLQNKQISCQSRKTQNQIDNASNRLPKGIMLVDSNIILITNLKQRRFKFLLQYLEISPHIRHIIIDNYAFATNHYIDVLRNKLPNLQGIHILSSFRLDPNPYVNSNIKELSLFPNYRFMRTIDKCTYFSNVAKRKTKFEILSKFEEYLENPPFKIMYVCKNTPHLQVPKTVEQLNFLKLEIGRSWAIQYQTLSYITAPKNMKILTFTNIIFKYASACFKTIFLNNKSLHTLVFKNCSGYHDKLVKQMRYLMPSQLKHLQISGNNLEKKISLNAESQFEIFSHVFLETLILTNIEFVTMTRDYSPLEEISNLRFLTHLNLYSSSPVCDKLLRYIDKDCKKNMQTLNLGFAQITPASAKYFSSFHRLENLCVDYTSLGDFELIKITNHMPELRYLSIENLNGATKENGQKYGIVTGDFFKNLRFKALKYVNIYNCQKLSNYLWKGFDQIDSMRINKGLYSDGFLWRLRGKGINFLIEQGEIATQVKQSQQVCKNALNNSSKISNSEQKYNSLSFDPQFQANASISSFQATKNVVSASQNCANTQNQQNIDNNKLQQAIEANSSLYHVEALQLPAQEKEQEQQNMQQH